jgi:hypothetical protein
MVVEDSNINGHPVYTEHGPGPYEAVQDFMGYNDDFVIDDDRERFMFTCSPSGFLKRTKNSYGPGRVLELAEMALAKNDQSRAREELMVGEIIFPDVQEIKDTLNLIDTMLEGK